MAEIIQKDGTWAFDGDTLRIVPGSDKSVGLLRRTLGEVAVPLRAVAGIAYEAGRKSGRLRLRLRDGADPLLQVTGGKLPDGSDPYVLAVETRTAGVAEYLVDEIRNALLLDEVPDGPVDAYLLPGPALPMTVGAGDGTVTFDGRTVRLEWTWHTDDKKTAAGPVSLPLDDLTDVVWQPARGLSDGYLRFVTTPHAPRLSPAHDPMAVELNGFKKDPLMALLASAVVARLPHPHAPARELAAAPRALESAPKALESAPAAPAAPAAEDHDVLLRRLRELGELHRGGVLTDEEFAAAKQAVLKRL
ncbi:Tat pathway signal sequence domain protein [Streptomyces sp. CB01201]|uniref:DUF4429 domain-containing protein n=1 Tax=Streptomyces sp. CB01201 TaxID=2020324 RepID=UPI000C27E802|nr:DUF4429 domain-containing protein [Streptomyces sp. CB01201]PJM99450.1 Tat pathway signal sequence domain protein [Streptomyces sp. CB01201]